MYLIGWKNQKFTTSYLDYNSSSNVLLCTLQTFGSHNPGRPQKHDEIIQLIWRLINKIQVNMEILSNCCDLLRIYELFLTIGEFFSNFMD